MSKSLKKQVYNGLAWRGSTDIIQQVLQIVFTIVLARLLTKGDFGLVAMALVVNRFFIALTNIGFGGAIIRSTDVTDGQISAIFYIQLLLNTVLSIGIFFLSGVISNFFNEEKLVQLIEVTAWIILLKSFQFPTILMRKNLQFKSFSLIEISSMVIANTVAIIMAFRGFGFWALVVRLFVQRLCFGLGTWIVIKWRPITPEFRGLKPILIYGFNMQGSNLLSYFSENLIAIIISKFLGKEIMGLFNIAYNLAIVPATKIKSVLLSVLTPGFAKIQLNMVSFTKNNKKVLQYLGLSFIPFMFLLSGMSENIILFMYGKKWAEAGDMLLILALVGMLKGTVHLLRSSILVKGKAQIILKATLIELMFSIPVMYFCMSSIGVYGLLIGYASGAFVSLLYIVKHYNALFEVPMFFRTVKMPFVMAIFIFIVAYIIGQLESKLIIEIMVQLLASVILYFILLKIFYTSFANKIISKIKFIVKL